MTAPRLDPATTAVLVIDMQNDFCHPDGFYNTRGGRPSGSLARAIEPIAGLLEDARSVGALCAYTRWVYPTEGDATAGRLIHPADWASYDSRLQAGTWGAEIVDDLRPRDGEPVIDKNSYSGFHETGLEDILRSRGIRSLVITGTVAYACVLHTAFDAFVRGFDVILVSDGVSGWFDDLDDAAQRIVGLLLGITASAAEVAAMLSPALRDAGRSPRSARPRDRPSGHRQ